MTQFRHTVAQASQAAHENPEEPYTVALARGSLELGYYTPVGVDHQQPHDRDELYVVVSGAGSFMMGNALAEFGPGDALFVPAGVEHRFVNFSDDTEMWVIFYGPVGGEVV